MAPVWPPPQLPRASNVAAVVGLGAAEFAVLPVETKLSCLVWLCAAACQAPEVKKFTEESALGIGALAACARDCAAAASC